MHCQVAALSSQVQLTLCSHLAASNGAIMHSGKISYFVATVKGGQNDKLWMGEKEEQFTTTFVYILPIIVSTFPHLNKSFHSRFRYNTRITQLSESCRNGSYTWICSVNLDHPILKQQGHKLVRLAHHILRTWAKVQKESPIKTDRRLWDGRYQDRHFPYLDINPAQDPHSILYLEWPSLMEEVMWLF